MRARRLLPPTVCLAALVLAGCDASSGGPARPSAGGSTTSSAATSPSASPSPTATGFTSTCDDALPLTKVSTAAGQPVIGRTAFVVGVPDPSIGRLAYLNCQYGLPAATTAVPKPATPPVPGVEIGVSLYDTPDRAKARVEGTVADYRNTGSTATSVRVSTVNGTVLTGGGPPTLVVALGARTAAVSVAPRLSMGADQLAALATLALDVS